MAKLTPTPPQAAAIAQMAAAPLRACLNASDTGTGKTLMAVELAIALEANTVLVVAPLNTHKGWVARFEGQGFPHPVKTITTKNADEFINLKAGVPGVYLVGREFFYLSATSSKEREDGTRARTAKWSWSKVPSVDLHIVDESHSAQNQFGKMFMNLRKVRSKYKLAMSGTPQGSRFEGIWAPTKWLWPDLVDGSKIRWIAEWCDTEEVVIGKDEDTADGLKRVTKITGERKPGAYMASLPCVVRLEAVRVPYQLFEVRVDLPAEQRAMWDEMAATSIAWLADRPTVAKLPIEQRIRLRQMALGAVSFDAEGELNFAPDCISVKLDKALKIQDRHPGEAILFVTDSARFATVAAPRLGARLLKGGMRKAEKDFLIDNLGVEYQYLVATYGAVAEGCDGLQAKCHVEVLFNIADSPVMNEQFNGRLNRTGQTSDLITRYTLVARDTMDDDHFDRAVANMEARRNELDTHTLTL